MHAHTHAYKNKGRHKGRNSTEHAFCYGNDACMLQEPICQGFFWRDGWCGTSKWNSSWLSLSSFLYRRHKEKYTKAEAEIDYLVYCYLTVSIISSGSRRGTPFIPNHLKLGPSVKIRLHQLFTQHTANKQPTESFNKDRRWSNSFTGVHSSIRHPYIKWDTTFANSAVALVQSIASTLKGQLTETLKTLIFPLT